MLCTRVSDQYILNLVSEPFYFRRDGGRSSPACQAPSGIARRTGFPHTRSSNLSVRKMSTPSKLEA